MRNASLVFDAAFEASKSGSATIACGGVTFMMMMVMILMMMMMVVVEVVMRAEMVMELQSRVCAPAVPSHSCASLQTFQIGMHSVMTSTCDADDDDGGDADDNTTKLSPNATAPRGTG
jgi:hypothetical protein